MNFKKVLALFLSATMLLGTMAFAATASSATSYPSIVEDAADLLTGADYSTVYYGGIPWMVLNTQYSDGQDNPTYGAYLLSKYAYGYGTPWNAHFGPGENWNKTGIFARLDSQYFPEGYNGNPGNTLPTQFGYYMSDIRKYMNGAAEYDAVYPRSMFEHNNPDDIAAAFYYERVKVTDTEPAPGVTYYTKGQFKLSTDSNNHYTTLAVDEETWREDTWYTYDSATGTYNLVEEAPAPGETIICYHDATEYYSVGELDAFEPGVTYYTFKKVDRNDPYWSSFNTNALSAHSVYKGALYAAFSVTDMKTSTSASGDGNGENRVIFSGNMTKNFADDMEFSAAERAAVLPTSREGFVNSAPLNTEVWCWNGKKAYSDTMSNDTYFLPSSNEILNYVEAAGIPSVATYADGSAAQYWIRSLLRYDRAGMVDGGGGHWHQQPSNINMGIRPAFNLNPEAVKYFAPASDVDFGAITTGTNSYKLVLEKDSSAFTAEATKISFKKVVVNYKNADADGNEYISAVLRDENGNLVAYGRVGEANSANGTVEISLNGLDVDGCSLYVFNEEANGDYNTNYASNEVEVAVFELAEDIALEFEEASKTEEDITYNINIRGNAGIINRLNSVDLTFALTQGAWGKNEYEIIASNEEVAINKVSEGRYEFHYNGKTNVETDTSSSITIGQVKFTGYGEFTFGAITADTNAAHATTLVDNIVDTFVPGGVLADGTDVGDFDISDDTIKEIEIEVPTRKLTINVAFPNNIVNNDFNYQDMQIIVEGSDIETITLKLGEDATFANNTYTAVIDKALTLDTTYNVTVKGAGYRTARYSVRMTAPKTLNFWNNVKDNKAAMEVYVDEFGTTFNKGEANTNFLAGDIVADNTINIYDLSAVVSYFGEVGLSATNNAGYAKYDLNRDGKIDSKDVAYVLVSWNK